VRWRNRAVNLLRYVLLQKRVRVRGRGLASPAHVLLFGGFCLLFLGTTLIAVEHALASALGRPASHPVFHQGLYYAVFEIVLDSAGLALLAGCAYFAFRNRSGPGQPARSRLDLVVLALLSLIAMTGFVLEGLRLVHVQTPMPGISYVGYLVSRLFQAASLAPTAAGTWHRTLWWFHAALSMTLIALFPWCRLRHGLAGAVRLSAGVERLGSLSAVSIEQVEETGEIGASRIDQFTRRQLVELDACVSCGRCDEMCPALEAGKPLSPRQVVQDLRQHLDSHAGRVPGPTTGAGPGPEAPPALAGTVIGAETLWSCTTCSACVDVCPLGVSPLGFLTEMRRDLVASAKLRGAPASALQKTGRSGNPWGLPARDRLAWIGSDLTVPTVTDNPDFEVLYWVGCAAAYDRRLQRVARSIVKLLAAARVSFAVLGQHERCTGEAARRMGDELLFQTLAGENLAAFERLGLSQRTRPIVSHCPHCVNSFRLDYSQLGAQLNAVHHSEFLAGLVRSGRLAVPQAGAAMKSVTYHDPCYLSRVWDVVDPPRRLLTLATQSDGLVEMPRHGRQTACCGAGGGRIWLDDSVETRVGRSRIAEALDTGAQTLAVACPFCLIMTSDGLAAHNALMEVRDIAEILVDSIERNASR
jgi:Fe-S oxidoreductase/nitrate reductase gamma subunit